VVIDAGVGASPVVRDRDRAIGVEGDAAPGRAMVLSLVGGVGQDFEDQVEHTAGAVLRRMLSDAGEMISIHRS
jgi:hypothetical protein